MVLTRSRVLALYTIEYCIVVWHFDVLAFMFYVLAHHVTINVYIVAEVENMNFKNWLDSYLVVMRERVLLLLLQTARSTLTAL